MTNAEGSVVESTGACFCGAIEYRVELEGARVGICHCRDCQIFSGSAFRMACAVDPARFEIVKGSPRHFDKRAASGKVRRMAFCGECGTHLCSLPGDGEGYVSVRISTSRDFHRFAPTVEIFCESRVAWLPALEGARQEAGMPTAEAMAGAAGPSAPGPAGAGRGETSEGAELLGQAEGS